jgi:hypothetical protein
MDVGKKETYNQHIKPMGPLFSMTARGFKKSPMSWDAHKEIITSG